MTILATELPPVYRILSVLGYALFAFSVATVVCGLLFFLYRFIDKHRR